MHFSCSPCVLHAPIHCPWYNHPGYILWKAQIMKLFIRCSSPVFHYFIPQRCKYSPKHLVFKTSWTCDRFQVLMAASMKMTALWDTAPCSLLGVYQHFRSVYCLHHQGDEPSWFQELVVSGLLDQQLIYIHEAQFTLSGYMSSKDSY
jgi:hypothetical protein